MDQNILNGKIKQTGEYRQKNIPLPKVNDVANLH